MLRLCFLLLFQFIDAPLNLAKFYEKELKLFGIDLPSPSAELSERDWVLLLTGAQVIKLKSGETLMTPGEQFSWLYYVQEGTIRLQRPAGASFDNVLTITSGKPFGETSLISENICPFLVSAGPNGATVAAISPAFLFQVAESHPELGRRLSLLLARKLAKSMSDAQTPAKKLAKRAPSMLQFRQEAPEELKRTEKIVERFDLERSEVYVRESPAILCSKQKLHGSLCLTKNFVLFFAQVFGFKKKKTIPIRSISEIQCADEKLEVTMIRGNGKKSITFRFEPAHYVEMKPLLSSIHQATLGFPSSPRTVPTSSRNERSGLKSVGHQLHMSREDWNLLLQGDHAFVRYAPSETVVKMGQEYACLYQIASGSCRIEREDRKGSEIIGWLKPGQCFGEISFLIGGSATASVIAEEETCIYVLDTVFLSILFHSDPLLAARLYFYLAEQLGERLLRSEPRSVSPAPRSTRSDLN